MSNTLDTAAFTNADIRIRATRTSNYDLALYRSVIVQYTVGWDGMTYIQDLPILWTGLDILTPTEAFAHVTKKDYLPREFMTADFQASMQERFTRECTRVEYSLEEDGSITFLVFL